MEFMLEDEGANPSIGITDLDADLSGSPPEKIDIRDVLVHDDLLKDFGKH